ncbi:MAG: hypothetical protein JSW61_12915 [Candidatus Thorarchaeota archaeon]|nr:MAG: hypothetical protein JSW61_12915 [Candidatus Thorarchaeota archaeon]
MSEAIFNSLAIENEDMHVGRVHAQSAGVNASMGKEPENLAVEIMAEHGIDIRQHTSRPVTLELIQDSDLVLTLEQRHKDIILEMLKDENQDMRDKVCTLTGYVGESGDVEDCYGKEFQAYKQCADRLTHLITNLIRKLSQESSCT